MAEPQQQSPGLLANILAVAGFIILIVIIVWGAYHLLRLTGSGVSSLFSRFGSNSSTIALTIPSAPAQSGKSFPLSWKYSPKENGTYAFLYQCKAGLRMEATSPSGSTASVPCGNAFTVGNNTSMTLTPTLTGTSTIEVPVSVVFMPSATSSATRPQGTATIRISPAAAGTATGSTGGASSGSASGSTSSGTKPTTGVTPTKPVVTGPADLSVQILAVGVIDPVTGAFIQRPPMNPNEIAAVKFDIGNRGGTATGVWYFNVQLPTNPSYLYQSPAQMSLAPGSHIENILRFRPMSAGGGTVNVYVDPQNMVGESNESNNTVSQWVTAQQWSGYPYQAPYVY